MTTSDKLREFAEKWGIEIIEGGHKYDFEFCADKCLSDLTALISEEKAKYDEAVRQRDELKRMLNSLILSICAHPDYVDGEEEDEWHDLVSLAEAAIKNTETK